MPRLWKHRPSPAMIVAMLALFVSMGGTGYAVSKLPKRSVGPAQLRKNAVRSEHIKAGSITTAKLAKSTLSSLRSPVAAPALAGGSSARGSRAHHAGPRRLRRQGRDRRQGDTGRPREARRPGDTADEAAAADTAAVADHAKLADNASKLGGKSVAEFLTSDTIRWITPFTIDEGTREMLKVGPFTLTARCTLDETIGGVGGSGPGRHHHLDDAGRSPRSTARTCSAVSTRTTDIETRQFVNTAVAAHGAAKFEASSDGLAIGGDGVLYIKGSYLFAGVNVGGQPDKCKFGGYLFL